MLSFLVQRVSARAGVACRAAPFGKKPSPFLLPQSNTTSTGITTTRSMATKKAGGSSNNGRDSAGRRLGIKIFPGHHAKAGSILVRQRGRKFQAGDNVGMGRDHTIFAKMEGIVHYTRNRNNKKRNVVHVLQNS